jgi:hypothetical protein
MAKQPQIDFKRLSTVPIDVRKIILKEQQKEKDKRGIGKYSIQLTLIKIVREWNNKCNQQ